MKAKFQDLISFCEKVGWDKGISELEKNVYRDEILQAELFAGNYLQRKQAMKLSKIITKKNITIFKLKKYKKDNNL